jgi:hypothetical protein
MQRLLPKRSRVETVGAGAQLRWRPGRGLALMAALVILGLGWALPPPAGWRLRGMRSSFCWPRCLRSCSTR